jgi:hypothetical protein
VPLERGVDEDRDAGERRGEREEQWDAKPAA